MITINNNSGQALEFYRSTWHSAYLTIPPYASTSYSDEEYEGDLVRQLELYYTGSQEIVWEEEPAS